MFNQITIGSNDISSSAANLSSAADGIIVNDALSKIRDRLERDLPSGPYITDDQFARILGVNKKSLSNKRSVERDNEEKIYPVPIRLGNCRHLKYPRSVLIEWFAKQELHSRARTVHRCR
jgi:hypothetical protein